MALPSPVVEACPNHPDVSSGLVHCARCGTAYCPDCVVELEGRPYDAACKEEQVRDLRSGVASAVDIASAGRRFVSMFVDGLVFSPVWIGLIFLVPPETRMADPTGSMLIWSIAVPALIWTTYETVMLVQFDGQTLGKKAMGIRVVSPDGSAVTVGQALRRAISRNVMTYTYVLGFVDALMVFSRDRRTLHDRVAGTIVVNWKP